MIEEIATNRLLDETAVGGAGFQRDGLLPIEAEEFLDAALNQFREEVIARTQPRDDALESFGLEVFVGGEQKGCLEDIFPQITMTILTLVKRRNVFKHSIRARIRA